MNDKFPELTVILRDRVNDLLQANADLEREVAKLRYAHSAMQAAEEAQADAKSTRSVSSTCFYERERSSMDDNRTPRS